MCIRDRAQAVALNDIKQQLSHLVYPGFVRETPAMWLKELPRYLKAIELRLEKLPGQVQKDRVWSGELSGLWAQYQARATKHAQEGKRDPQLELYRWWLEEYRVSLFGQMCIRDSHTRAPSRAARPETVRPTARQTAGS